MQGDVRPANFADVSRTNSPDKPQQFDLPTRNWSIEIFFTNEKNEDIPATALDKVTYNLHPSFGKRAKQGA